MADVATSVLVHIPYELREGADIAPQIRPRRIIQAFRDAGATVDVVAGAPRQRKEIMGVLRREIAFGKTYDLVYSESAGWPNAFSDGGRSFHPWLDVSFLKFLHRSGFPVGLFFRDAYHRDPSFFAVPRHKKVLRWILYLFASHDLRGYNTYVDRLYLPSLAMRTEVPEFTGVVDELPPGALVSGASPREHTELCKPPLKLLYVGGLGSLYRLHLLLEAVLQLEDVTLTICTRESDWLRVRDEYEPFMCDRVHIVHKSQEELAPYFNEADVAILSVEPSRYRAFAYPVKLFEYLGFGLPVLATVDTLAGEYVRSNSLGWTVPYKREPLREVLLSLIIDREGILDAGQRVRTHAPSASWRARARKVMNDLVPSVGD